jgi:hypothetical protein
MLKDNVFYEKNKKYDITSLSVIGQKTNRCSQKAGDYLLQFYANTLVTPVGKLFYLILHILNFKFILFIFFLHIYSYFWPYSYPQALTLYLSV